MNFCKWDFVKLSLIVVSSYIWGACTCVSDYKREIAQMQSAPLVLPLSEMNCVMNGVDTLLPISPVGLKYVVYSDT